MKKFDIPMGEATLDTRFRRNARNMSLKGCSFFALLFFQTATAKLQLPSNAGSKSFIEPLAKALSEEFRSNRVYLVKLASRDRDGYKSDINLIALGRFVVSSVPSYAIGKDHASESWSGPNSRKNQLHILLQFQRKLGFAKSVKRYIDRLYALTMIIQDCKFLVAMHEKCEGDYVQELLDYAWTLKILDFTILEMAGEECSSGIAVNYLNPFFNASTREYFVVGVGGKLFPSKLQDMNGYPVRVSFFHRPPQLVIERRESEGGDGGNFSLSGPDYDLLRTLERKINFQLVSEISEDAADGGFLVQESIIDSIFERLLSRNIDMMGTLLLPDARDYFKFASLSACVRTESLSALTPILHRLSYRTSDRFLLLAGTIVFATGFLLLVRKVLMFEVRYWGGFSLFAALLAMPVHLPRKTRERIVFGCVLLMSLVFTTSFVRKLVKVDNFFYLGKPIRTFADLDNSQLRIMAYPYFIDFIFGEDEVFRSLAGKTTPDYNVECVRILMERRDIACILFKSDAVSIVNNEIMKLGEPTTQIVQQPFYTSELVVLFDPKSPYIKKFHDIFYQLNQAGLSQSTEQKRNDAVLRYNDDFSRRYLVLRFQLLLIYVIGNGVALLAFATEHIFQKCRVCEDFFT